MCNSPDCKRGTFSDLPWYYKAVCFAFLGVMGFALYAGVASATDSIDISQTTYNTEYTWGTATNGGNTRTICQSFKPTKSTVSRVDFALATILSWTSSRDMAFYLTSGGCIGQGGSTTLASHTLTESEYNSFNGSSPITAQWILDSAVSVTPGSTYYVAMRDLDACNLCYKTADNSTSVYGDGSEWRGTWTDGFNEQTRDIYFRTYYREPVDVTISATATDDQIAFSGTFDPGEADMISLEVSITGPNLSYYTYNFNPPSPFGTFDSEELSGANNASYQNGSHIILVTACSTDGCSTASTSVLVGYSTIFDEPIEYTPPLTIQEYDQYISSGGYIFSASTVQIVGDGGLIISEDGCATIDDSSTSTLNTTYKGLVKCQIQRFEGIPPLSWVYGLYRAYGDAYVAASASSGEPVVLAITGGGYNIPIFDTSSSTTPEIVSYAKQMFPNYYEILVLILWVNFAFANAQKGWAVFNNQTPGHHEEQRRERD